MWLYHVLAEQFMSCHNKGHTHRLSAIQPLITLDSRPGTAKCLVPSVSHLKTVLSF